MKELAAKVLAGLGLAAIPAVFWSRLPEPLAQHWGRDGQPDGSGPRLVALGLPVGVWLVAAAGARGRRGLPVCAYAGTLAALLQIQTVAANLDRDDWHDARPISWLTVAALLTIPAAASWAAWRFVPGPDPVPPVPPLPLPDGERVVWVSRVTNRPMVLGGGLALATGITLCGLSWPSGGAGAAIGVPVALVGAAVLCFASARVEAGPTGVRIAYGSWGFPVWRKALGAISSAHVETLRPVQVGGWGLRGLPGHATLMIRAGECLVLDYPGGRRFAVSVDDAEAGAALLNGLLGKARV